MAMADGELVGAMLQEVEQGRGLVLVTVVGVRGDAPCSLGGKVAVKADGRLCSSLGDGELDRFVADVALQALAAEQSRTLSYPPPVEPRGQGDQLKKAGYGVDLFLEVLQAPPTLIIVGAGHIAQPLSKLGKLLDFHVVILDDRPDFANRERFPEADEVLAADFEETLRSFPITSSTCIVLVTRGHKYDEASLRVVIASGKKAGYIGMIGSRRRVKAVLNDMTRDGFSPEALAEMHAPIGLDIGAETPAEIAVCIVGEIIKVRRGGTAQSLALKSKRGGSPIHQQRSRGVG